LQKTRSRGNGVGGPGRDWDHNDGVGERHMHLLLKLRKEHIVGLYMLYKASFFHMEIATNWNESLNVQTNPSYNP
jgi:hypothetical protein